MSSPKTSVESVVAYGLAGGGVATAIFLMADEFTTEMQFGHLECALLVVVSLTPVHRLLSYDDVRKNQSLRSAFLEEGVRGASLVLASFLLEKPWFAGGIIVAGMFGPVCFWTSRLAWRKLIWRPDRVSLQRHLSRRSLSQ